MRLEGVAYRAHNPAWSWSPLSGEGAALFGGRFNPKGTPALYLSLAWETAVLEASQGFAYRIPPLTIVSYDVDCTDIADLTDAEELRRRHAKPGDLKCPWKLLAETGRPVPSWTLAKQLIGDGVAGIVVPSFAPGARAGARNAVFWRWSGALPHKVAVIDPDGRLPHSAASWER